MGTERRSVARPGTSPVREHIVTDASESFLWRCDDYPWERNVWNIHPEYEIHLVRNASGIALVGDHIEPFAPGYLAVVGSGLPHDWVTATAPGEVIRRRDVVLQFDPARLRAAAPCFPELRAVEPFLDRALRGLAIEGGGRDEAAALLEAMEHAGGVERLALFVRLLAVLTRAEARVLASADYLPSGDDAAQSTLQAVLGYLKTNFKDGDMGLAAVAARFGMSPWGFSRFFKRHSGVNPADYLTSLRMSYACQLLADTVMPVTDICFEVGYNNVSNFNRTFRRLRGVPPSAYRRHACKRVTQRAGARLPGSDDSSLRAT